MTFSGTIPMVNELERVAASMLGKEAALFLPSGTMGNVVGVAVNTRPGEEMIADADAHVYLYETAGAAVIAGVQIRPVADGCGRDDAGPDRGRHPAARRLPSTHHRGGELRGHSQPPWGRRVAVGGPARGVRGGSRSRPPSPPRRRSDLQCLGGGGNRRR